MPAFEFDIFVGRAPSTPHTSADAFADLVEGPLFEAFQGDVTPGARGGRLLISCHLEAGTLGEAIDSVLTVITPLGFYASVVEVEDSAEVAA
ncbi:MAG: hypothetical protein AAGI71_03145 [Bacteroidota bacterium]